MNTTEVLKIIDISKQYHKGQTYGRNKLDYFTAHIEHVVSNSVEIAKEINSINGEEFFDLNLVRAVAYLHDVVEDHVKIEILDKTLLNIIEDYNDFFDLTWAISEITYKKDEYYFNYINNISSKYSILVKLADLNVNIKNSYKGFKKLDLYLFAREVVREKLRNFIKIP